MQRVAHSPVLTHSHSPRSASCSKSGRTRTKTRARAVELRSSAGPVVAACLVRQDATPVLYSFPLAMRRSLVSLDSQAPEVGAGAAGDGMIFSASILSGCIVSGCIICVSNVQALSWRFVTTGHRWRVLAQQPSLLPRNGVDVVPHPLRGRFVGALPDEDHVRDLPSEH